MTDEGLALIMKFEGCKLTAYKCPAGKWTIGYGATHYLDGSKVKEGDKLKSKEEAIELLKNMVKSYEASVEKLVTAQINPNQKDALISFTYNVGALNLGRSTLLKKVNNNPNDKTIKDEFAKWVNADGKVVDGLVRRRKAEADFYFKKWDEPLPEYDPSQWKGPYYPGSDNDNSFNWPGKPQSSKK